MAVSETEKRGGWWWHSQDGRRWWYDPNGENYLWWRDSRGGEWLRDQAGRDWILKHPTPVQTYPSVQYPSSVQDNSLRVTWKWHLFGYCVSGPLYLVIGLFLSLMYIVDKPRDWLPLEHFAFVTCTLLTVAIAALLILVN